MQDNDDQFGLLQFTQAVDEYFLGTGYFFCISIGSVSSSRAKVEGRTATFPNSAVQL